MPDEWSADAITHFGRPGRPDGCWNVFARHSDGMFGWLLASNIDDAIFQFLTQRLDSYKGTTDMPLSGTWNDWPFFTHVAWGNRLSESRDYSFSHENQHTEIDAEVHAVSEPEKERWKKKHTHTFHHLQPAHMHTQA